MRAAEVVVGQVYLANVSGRVVPVRIERPVLVGFRQRRAWEATNLVTGRRVLIRSAQRLRQVAPAVAVALSLGVPPSWEEEPS